MDQDMSKEFGSHVDDRKSFDEQPPMPPMNPRFRSVVREASPPGAAGTPEDQERERQERAAYEMSAGYRRAEFLEFHEQLTPEAVRHFAKNAVGIWLDRWFERGEEPNKYRVEDVTTSARGRTRQLLETIPLGLHKPTLDERDAGIIPGFFLREVTPDFVLSPETDVKEVDRGGGVKEKVWLRNNREVGLYVDDTRTIKFTGEDPDRHRARLYIGKRVTEKEASGRREELAKEIELQTRLIEAWTNVMEKVNEQDLFSGDDKGYLFDRFVRVGKVIARSRFYADILNSPESHEGLPPLGKKIQEAIAGIKDIGEGRAVVKVSANVGGRLVEKTGLLPNHFAYAQNQGLREMTLQYLQSRIAQKVPSSVDESRKTKTMKLIEERDNRVAAIAALIFADHWDMDANYAYNTVWGRNPDTGSIEEKNMVFEVSYVDSAKLMYATHRRTKEYYGWARFRKDAKSHPREAGAPISLYFLPKLSSDFLEVTSVQTMGNQLAEGRAAYSGRKPVSVTIDQLVYGTKDANGKRVVFEIGGKKYSRIRVSENSANIKDTDYYDYPLLELGDRKIWDNIQMLIDVNGQNLPIPLDNLTVESGQSVENSKSPDVLSMDFIQGTNTNATEITKALLEMYAFAGVFQQFTRTDLITAWGEIKDPEQKKLRSLNKKFELGTKILARQYQLSSDTTEALEEFLRIGYVASIIGSIASNNDTNVSRGQSNEGLAQTSTSFNAQQAVRLAESNMFRAHFVKTTVTTNPGDEGDYLTWANPKDKVLFDAILEKRAKAPLTPFDYDYFTPSQAKELEPLYDLFLPEVKQRIQDSIKRQTSKRA